MSLNSRPYIGTWKLGAQKLVQVTPDALVYVNGDLTLPGCQRCHSSIDLQKFITEVSVDAGCDSGSGSASFTLAIPSHHRDSFIRDAKFILRPGLEVHIYMRGYFPVKGMYSNLAQQTQSRVQSGDDESDAMFEDANQGDQGMPVLTAADSKKMSAAAWKDRYEDTFRKVATERYPDKMDQDRFVAQTLIWSYNECGGRASREFMMFGQKAGSVGTDGLKGTSVMTHEFRQSDDPNGKWKKGDAYKTPQKFAHFPTAYDATVGHAKWQEKYGVEASTRYRNKATKKYSGLKGFRNLRNQMGITQTLDERTGKNLYVLPSKDGVPATTTTEKLTNSDQTEIGPSTLESMDLDVYDIENVLAYPYYHVFHGVMTQVSLAYSAGIHTATIQCVSMLHFWQYQQMSTNASVFGARAPNSGNKMSMLGNNFTGKHPYEIMYALHHDTAGAAAGVSWALAQKNNQTASSDLTGESLYSLNLKYWQKRFSLKDIKLRMHGVSGEMFNSVQAAFLASASSGDLMSLVRGRFNGTQAKGYNILSQAVSVGLYNKRRLEALVQSRSRRPPGQNASSTKLEINMAEMHAFVSDVAQWGQIQLFESTYESKLDVANKVCEATGFEFYQDVDGDFVFKPPMYNLDTSGSRVYRIEDIDIISINFEEKEPQVTYMVCKGSHFSNIKIGLDNEMGVQGQYIDYRLVSQYGWRPGNFESAYFTDGMSMFYAAVNRLDVMNAPTKSGSLTIPLRPELRPGYPVYIPYLDCFYYCNSFAHSFSVGSGCTTSLQLIGKRSKFFAPGHPDKRGIEAIDMSNTLLPEKPLEVLDLSGRPRLSGFPNVVMALDPNQIDPMFLIVGSDVDKITDPATLEYLMKQAVRLAIVDSWPDNSGERPGPYYIVRSGEGQQGMWFYLKTPNSVPEDQIAKQTTTSRIANDMKGAINMMNAAGELITYQKDAARKAANALPKLEREANAAKKLQEAANKAAEKSGANEAGTAASKALDNATAKALNANHQLQGHLENQAIENMQATDISENDHSKLAEFRRLLRRVTDKFQAPDSFQSEFSGDPRSSITLLEMLSDKKAVFSNKALPGSYRYYSSSSPHVKDQGQDLLTIRLTKDADTIGKKLVTTEAYLEPLWKELPCKQYVVAPTTSPDGLRPEAELQDKVPERGIMVFTNNTNYPAGEVLPTSEIRELMFASHQVFHDNHRGSNPYTVAAIVSGDDMVQAWKRNVSDLRRSDSIGTPVPTDTLEKAMGPWLTSMSKAMDTAFTACKAQIVPSDAAKIPDFPLVALPIYIAPANGGQVYTKAPLNSYVFDEDKDENGKITAEGMAKVNDKGILNTAWVGSDVTPIKNAWVPLARVYVEAYFNAFMLAQDAWIVNMQANGLDAEVVDSVVSAYNNSLGSTTHISTTTTISRISTKKVHRVKGKKGKGGNGATLVSTPVFPISDAQGYHVIGSYRYGRDVTIDPDGVFDVLHRQDIFSMLSKRMVDNILRVFVRHQKIFIDTPDPDNPKLIKRVPEEGAAAEAELEKQVILDMQRNYSNADHLIHDKTVKDGNYLKTGLAAHLADGRDGITKLPIINAAYNLADLVPHTSRNFCSCKAAEASVLLDIAGTQEYVHFTEAGKSNYGNTSGDAPVDRTVQWVQQTTAQVALPWVQSQAALRGSVPTQKPTSIIQAAHDLGAQFDQQARSVDVAKAAFEASKKAAADAKKQLTEGKSNG